MKQIFFIYFIRGIAPIYITHDATLVIYNVQGVALVYIKRDATPIIYLHHN